jgi:hypothetical protein
MTERAYDLRAKRGLTRRSKKYLLLISHREQRGVSNQNGNGEARPGFWAPAFPSPGAATFVAGASDGVSTTVITPPKATSCDIRHGNSSRRLLQ